MLVSDIVKQLQGVLPDYTDFFSVKLSLSSLTESGGIVTAQTSASHGLSTGNFINITSTLNKTPVTSLTQVDGVATLTTSVFHDVTFGAEGYETITISGANEAQYNGTHTLLSVDTTKTLTFAIDSSAPATATGTIFLLEDRIGYNGRYEVQSTPTADTFTYNKTGVLPSGDADISSAFVKAGVRVSGAVSIDRLIEAYTEQDVNNMYAFVVKDGSVANNSRAVNNDANYQYESGQAYRQRIIENFSIYVFAPTQNSISARPQVDDMVEVRRALFKSLLSVKFDSGFNEGAKYGVTYLGDEVQEYLRSYYIHRFQFQIVENVNRHDIIDNKNTVAWRQFDIDLRTGEETFAGTMQVDGELPKSE